MEDIPLNYNGKWVYFVKELIPNRCFDNEDDAFDAGVNENLFPSCVYTAKIGELRTPMPKELPDFELSSLLLESELRYQELLN